MSDQENLRLYAVVIRDYSVVYVEYYWATDRDHALEQAINAHPTSRYDAVSLVPYVEPRADSPLDSPPRRRGEATGGGEWGTPVDLSGKPFEPFLPEDA